MQGNTEDSHGLVGWILLSVSLWGGLLAVGAGLFGYDVSSGEIQFAPNFVRGAIVFTCVTIFLGSWALLLYRRRSA